MLLGSGILYIFGSGINTVMQKANSPEMKHSHLSYSNSRGPINNIEVKNINQLAALASPNCKGNCLVFVSKYLVFV